MGRGASIAAWTGVCPVGRPAVAFFDRPNERVMVLHDFDLPWLKELSKKAKWIKQYERNPTIFLLPFFVIPILLG